MYRFLRIMRIVGLFYLDDSSFASCARFGRGLFLVGWTEVDP